MIGLIQQNRIARISIQGHLFGMDIEEGMYMRSSEGKDEE
jgi:hypothetical protein